MLENKLEVALSQKSGDIKGPVVVDGITVSRVSFPSRHGGSGKELGPAATRHLRDRLFVSADQLKELVECTMTRDAYRQHVRDNGHLG